MFTRFVSNTELPHCLYVSNAILILLTLNVVLDLKYNISWSSYCDGVIVHKYTNYGSHVDFHLK